MISIFGFGHFLMKQLPTRSFLHAMTSKFSPLAIVSTEIFFLPFETRRHTASFVWIYFEFYGISSHSFLVIHFSRLWEWGFFSSTPWERCEERPPSSSAIPIARYIVDINWFRFIIEWFSKIHRLFFKAKDTLSPIFSISEGRPNGVAMGAWSSLWLYHVTLLSMTISVSGS